MKSYQYGPGGRRLSQTTVAAGGARTDGFYGYNPHTDVETVTDSAGDTRSTYGYTAYGSNDTAGFTGIDNPDLNRFLTRDTYTGALADLNLGTDPYTGNRYAFAGGNPVTGIELDGHLTGAACGPDGTACGMTDMGDSSGYTPGP